MNKLPTLAPQTMGEAMEFSKMVASSGMVPNNYKGKPQDVLVAVQWGYELGLQPLQALQNIAVINGKPSVYGDAALALVKNDPRCAGVSEWVEGEGDNKIAYCKVKRRYHDQIEETVKTFSVADAKRARLWGKVGPWTQYPDRMLTMRARGFALRDAFPDALKGVVTAEEAQDYPTEPKNVTPPSNPLDAIEGTLEEPGETEQEQPIDDTLDDVIDIPDEPESQETTEAVQVFHLKTHRGTDMESFTSSADYAIAFGKLLQRYINSDRDKNDVLIETRQRMTMLRELREANQASLDSLTEEEMQPIGELYQKTLKRLGAELNNAN